MRSITRAKVKGWKSKLRQNRKKRNKEEAKEAGEW